MEFLEIRSFRSRGWGFAGHEFWSFVGQKGGGFAGHEFWSFVGQEGWGFAGHEFWSFVSQEGRRSPVAGGLRSAACPGRDDDDFDRGDLRQGEERPRPQYGLFAGAAGRTGYHRNRLSLGVRRTASFAPGDSRFAGLRVAQPFAKMILR